MGIKVCRCSHRKEHHLVENQRRVGCKECDCKNYALAEEFLQSGYYDRVVTGSYRAQEILAHLHRCGIKERIPCLYVVRVPGMAVVRIGKTIDLVYRWMSRMAEWPELFTVDPICIVKNGQDLEQPLHEHFRHLRRYSEWFDYNDEIEKLRDADRYTIELLTGRYTTAPKDGVGVALLVGATTITESPTEVK